MFRFCSLRYIAPATIQALQKSTSTWKWEDASKIAKLDVQKGLGLAHSPMNLTQQVFCELQIDKDKMLNDDSPTTHLDLPGVMAKMGFNNVTLPELDQMRAQKGDTFVQDYLSRLKYKNMILSYLWSFMTKLKRSVRSEAELFLGEQKLPNEKRPKAAVVSDREWFIDPLAFATAQICGFADPPLTVTLAALDVDHRDAFHQFKMFGEPVADPPDVFIARHSSKFLNKVVIFFEDKLEASMQKQGHLGQILGECIMMQYRNIIHHKFSDSIVYCIRIVDHFAQFFALECTKAELEAVCLEQPAAKPHGKVTLPSKLRLRCHQADPTTSRGLDLIDMAQRKEAMEIAAAMYAELLK